MDNKEKGILASVANIVDDMPTYINVSIKPKGKVHKFLQLLKIKPLNARYAINGATLRTMTRISKLILEIEVLPIDNNEVLEWNYKAIAVDNNIMAKIVAVAIHNKKSEVPQSLIDEILDNFTAKELKAVFDIVFEKLNIMDFMNTITSVRTINVLKPQTEVSQKVTEGIIASGEQLEELPSIFGSATILS